MLPVSGGARGQLLPAFHEENARIADFAGSFLCSAKTLFELWLVLFAVGEARRGGFSPANAASHMGAVDFWLVKAEHCDVGWLVDGCD